MTKDEWMKFYRAHLRSEKWARKRTDVVLRGRGRCERCRTWPISHVHHLTYERFGDEPLADLLGVCVRCHKELEDDKKRAAAI